MHSVTVLESSKVAGGSSGKAGGLLAEWATPRCLAPLSFKTHAHLAKEHSGDTVWGYRNVHCADVTLQAQELDTGDQFPSQAKHESYSQKNSYPAALNWLLPKSIKSYTERGT